MSTEQIKVIAGLGNPGSKYAMNRHNAGFMLLDKICLGYNWKEKGSLLCIKLNIPDLYLIKPQSFMNLSGEPIRDFLSFYKFEARQLLVVHDEVDLPLGTIKLKFDGGSAGHNGVKSVIAELGTTEFYRLRLGIGKSDNVLVDTSDWVLSNFDDLEFKQVELMLNQGHQAVEEIYKEGFKKVQAKFN